MKRALDFIKRKRKIIKEIKIAEKITLAFFFSGILFLFLLVYASLEEYRMIVAGTATDSVTISVEVAETISISSPSDEILSPEIVETGSASGDVIWNIETNDSDGWKMEVNASGSPALTKGSDSFADYTEATPGVPEAWSVAASDSEFGFSVGGSYAKAKYSNGALYEGFEGTSKIEVADDNSATLGGGADVQVNFQAEVGSGKSQEPGTYTATITATATTL